MCALADSSLAIFARKAGETRFYFSFLKIQRLFFKMATLGESKSARKHVGTAPIAATDLNEGCDEHFIAIVGRSFLP